MFVPRPKLGRAGTAIVAGSLIAMVLPAVVADVASAAPTQAACERRDNDTYRRLLNCVTYEGVREHQAALQEIADANGGTRAEQTPGYGASVDYVAQQLAEAGWDVTVEDFDYDELSAVLPQLTPTTETYEAGGYTGSAPGDVTGSVIPVDINLTRRRASSSGCEASDFDGLDFSGPNDIALIQRGTCFFSVKAVNAQTAGAEAVIIFNQGNSPDREGLIIGDGSELEDGSPTNITIPVVGASFADGEALAQPGLHRPGHGHHRHPDVAERARRARRSQRRQRRDGRRPPRLRPGGPRHQRQRQRVGGAHRGGGAARQS